MSQYSVQRVLSTPGSPFWVFLAQRCCGWSKQSRSFSDLVISQPTAKVRKNLNMGLSKCLLQSYTCKMGSKTLRTETGRRGRNNKIVKKSSGYRGNVGGIECSSLRRTV